MSSNPQDSSIAPETPATELMTPEQLYSSVKHDVTTDTVRQLQQNIYKIYQDHAKASRLTLCKGVTGRNARCTKPLVGSADTKSGLCYDCRKRQRPIHPDLVIAQTKCREARLRLLDAKGAKKRKADIEEYRKKEQKYKEDAIEFSMKEAENLCPQQQQQASVPACYSSSGTPRTTTSGMQLRSQFTLPQTAAGAATVAPGAAGEFVPLTVIPPTHGYKSFAEEPQHLNASTSSMISRVAAMRVDEDDDVNIMPQY